MKYYEAYNERYKTIHDKGYSWSSDVSTPIVLETIFKYHLSQKDKMLEIGCGEGRDAYPLLKNGYDLLATDVSDEAIRYCQEKYPKYAKNFAKLDCLSEKCDKKYRFIYAVAVVHMLVLDDDRNKFYSFIRDHLEDDGFALVCSMGDGVTEMKTNVEKAFDIVERNHDVVGSVMVASTSCRMVSFETFEKEIKQANLKVVEKGITSSLPDFDKLMYVVITK